MGSTSSKPNAASSSTSTSTSSFVVRKTRSKGSNVFQSYCLGQSSGSHDSDNDEQASDHPTKGTGGKNQRENRKELDAEQLKAESDGKTKVELPNDTICISSNINLDEWGQSSLSDTVSRAGNSSRAFSTRSTNPSSRFLSRFFPGNVSFRLSRTTSLGSSRACPVSSTSFAIRDNEEEYVDSNRITSPQDVAGDIDNNRVNADINLHSPRNDTIIGGGERRFGDGWSGSREPVERNVRFSRTLSVGRLRHRVLRRSSFPNLTLCPFQQERQVRDANQVLDENALIPPSSSGHTTSSMSSSLYRSEDYEVETSHAREARYPNPVEHRSTFLERRRRIRSQVRALQRLGNRFENLSGHESSCISSGQHRTGHCTCRISARQVNSNDETGARASISRIVMLAEALFEVLDEIHQQSVVLSTRPSVSSIGSVPAPNEVVECLPLKAYSKSQKQQNEETAQCYICLVEYEEGDSLRILPCRHEFHRICVDKWLKEIHRVCPLCRGDICRSDSIPAEN